MINVELLEATMGRILAEPENWYQRDWVITASSGGKSLLPEGNECGTAMCFAGHAAVLSGAIMTADVVVRPRCVDPFGRGWTIREYAMRTLGLSFEEADSLFSSDNTIDDLQRKVKSLVEKAGQTS